MFDVILWDIDNTLLDFHEPERLALKACFTDLGLGVCSDEMVQQYSQINQKYWEALERGEVSKTDMLTARFRDFLELRNLDVSKAEELNFLYKEKLGDLVYFMPNAKETVDFLKGKIRQVAGSNGSVAAQTKKLKISQLDQAFYMVFLSEDLGYEKPAPEFFDCVFKALNLKDRRKLLVVGDSLTSDIKGANDSGATSCWYNPFHVENKKGVVPDFEIDDLSKVIELVL